MDIPRQLGLFVVLALAAGAACEKGTDGPSQSNRQVSTRPAEDHQRCEALPGELHKTAFAIHEKQKNVGLAVLVRRNGETAFSETVGLADLEHGTPVTNETRFGIASLTKLFTAVTLLKLQAAGKIDLDAPVQRYLPRFPEKPEGEITIRMLATHRSGIPHPQERTPELFATHFDTATDALVVFEDAELVSVPGERRTYSSSNYNLLAAIVEQIEGKPFQEIVGERILQPLELDATSFDNILRPLPNRSRRYSFYHPWTYEESDTLYVVPAWDYSFNPGGGNMISTASDVARFGESLLSPGLLPEEQLDLLYDPGWFGEAVDDGERFIYATGANPGVQAGIAIYPAERLVGVALSNTWGIGSRSGEMAALANELVRRCGGM